MGELLAKATILAGRAVAETILLGLRLADKVQTAREGRNRNCNCPCDPKVGLSE